jgi:peptidoglycan/LPS O-acetylase OafA/YrhL
VQQTIMHYCKGTSSLELFVVAVPCTFLLAFFSWHFVESKALKLKNIDLKRIINSYMDKLQTKSVIIKKSREHAQLKNFTGK